MDPIQIQDKLSNTHICNQEIYLKNIPLSKTILNIKNLRSNFLKLIFKKKFPNSKIFLKRRYVLLFLMHFENDVNMLFLFHMFLIFMKFKFLQKQDLSKGIDYALPKEIRVLLDKKLIHSSRSAWSCLALN